MRYLSLFSGIEAATVAWKPLGWECVGVCEMDAFPNRVLKHHYPDVPNLGDVTKITEADIAALGPIDVLVFGSPCQDLSVAGKRKGLDGARSGLFFTAMRILGWAREWGGCRFALWENVPGAFSSNAGRDFAAVVDAMAGLDGTQVPPKGWGTEGFAVGEEAMVEWATLDAQWFGVAQRRRRVFALADFGDWRNRPPILLEPESLRGDSAPSREAGEGTTYSVAPCLTSSGRGVERTGDTRVQDAVVAQRRPVLSSTGEVAHCLNAGGMGRIDYETETETMVVCVTGEVTHALKDEGADASEDGTGRGNPIVVAFHSNAQACQLPNTERDTSVSDALTCSQNAAVAVVGCDTYNGNITGSVAATLGTQSGDGLSSGPSLLTQMGVRRLTPTECERLQAFPDGYTAIPKAADGPRYKALGNSMCVNVMRWIGREIDFAVRFF